MSSVVYPAVAEVEHIYRHFAGAPVVHVQTPTDLDPEQVAGPERVIQIRLGATASLKDADESLRLAIKALNESGKSYSVIFTADQPDEWIANKDESDPVQLVRHRRQANQVGADVESVVVANVSETGCFLFYAKSINVTVGDATAMLPSKNFSMPEVTCPSAEVKNLKELKAGFEFSLDFGKVASFSNVKLT